MREMRWPLLLLALGPASTALAQLPAPGDALVGLVPEDGALALDLARRSSGALWIANTGEGTVARFDTATREETGRFYGVTVDGAGRVWLGGTDLARYDPAAPVGRRWARAGLPWDESVVVHGVVADGVGGVWGALLGRGLLRADAEDPARWRVVEGSARPLHKGLALDDAGQVWSITLGGRADVALPGPSSTPEPPALRW